MSNKSYHATSAVKARTIQGPPTNISVQNGAGELGKGFYTGSSVALAASWAHTRYKTDGHVVEIEIDIAEFVKLKPRLIKTSEEVNRIWDTLKRNKTTDSFVFDCDYVLAPFATIQESGNQLKFESQKSEQALNSAKINLFPCV